MQRTAILREPDFNRPCRSDIGHAQHSGRDQPGPTRLLPGSPTLAPPVVKATELGFWMVLSTNDTPTAAIVANNKAATKTFMTLPQGRPSEPNYSAGMARGVLSDGAWPLAC